MLLSDIPNTPEFSGFKKRLANIPESFLEKIDKNEFIRKMKEMMNTPIPSQVKLSPEMEIALSIAGIIQKSYY